MFQAYAAFYHRVISYVTKFTLRKYWLLELTLLVFFYDLFVTFPSFDIFDEVFSKNWDNKYYHAAHLLEPLPFPEKSHDAKMAFRLFLPVLIRITALPPAGIIALKFLAGFLLLFLFARTTWQLTADKVQTCLFTFAFGCINTPKAAFDISGMVDTFGFFFLVLPFFYRRFLPVFLGVFLASWVDERGLIASSLVLLFMFFQTGERRVRLSLAVILAWGSYFAIRLYLGYAYGLTTPHSDITFANLIDQVSTVWLGIWGAFEGLWLPVLVALAYLVRDRRYIQALLITGSMGVVILVASLVYDITRSMDYLFPAFFMLLPVLVKRESPDSLRKAAFLAVMLSFLYPSYVVGGSNYVVWLLPLPMQLFRIFFM